MSPTCNRQPRCFPKTSIGRSWHPERQGEQALCAPTQILQYDPQAPPHRIGVSRAEIRAEQGTADNQCGQVLHFGHHIKGLVHPLDSYRPNILHSHFGLANNETDTEIQRKSWKNKAIYIDYRSDSEQQLCSYSLLKKSSTTRLNSSGCSR